jgi:hypothetical protein
MREQMYKVGDLMMVKPSINSYIMIGQGSTYKEQVAIITAVNPTLDVWYQQQDKYKYTYSILTEDGQIKKVFKHEIIPLEK